MGFFDNIGKAISDVGNSTIQKGKDAVSIAKFNRMIADEEKEASKAYEQLGKLYYESHAEDFEAGFAQLIDDIKASQARIREYQETLDELQGIVKCTQCGGNIPDGAAFCPECGAKVPVPEPEAKEEERDPGKLYCAECGAEITPGTKFCMACGTKVEILDDILPDAQETVEEAQEAVEEEINQEESAPETIEEASKAISDEAQKVSEALQEVQDQAIEAAATAKETVQEAILSAQEAVSDAAESIKETVQETLAD